MAVGKQTGAASSRYQRLSDSAARQELASWEDADPDELWRTITAIVNAGDAVTLGRTRDGGALSLVILSGDDRVRRYAHGADEVEQLLREIRETLEVQDAGA